MAASAVIDAEIRRRMDVLSLPAGLKTYIRVPGETLFDERRVFVYCFHKETGKEEHAHTPPFFNFSAFLQQPANLTPDLLRQHDPGILFQPSI